MGPFSETLQNKRKASLEKILATPGLSDDMKRIWQQHLNNLSVNEDEYNKRVVEVFRNVRRGGIYDLTVS